MTKDKASLSRKLDLVLFPVVARKISSPSSMPFLLSPFSLFTEKKIPPFISFLSFFFTPYIKSLFSRRIPYPLLFSSFLSSFSFPKAFSWSGRQTRITFRVTMCTVQSLVGVYYQCAFMTIVVKSYLVCYSFDSFIIFHVVNSWSNLGKISVTPAVFSFLSAHLRLVGLSFGWEPFLRIACLSSTHESS